MNTNRPDPSVSFFFKILDKGFNISVPASEESLYREGYDAFLRRVEKHSEGRLPLEAVALASLDCMVALQKSQNQLKRMISGFEEQMDELDATLLKAL